jgi:hypothetical protein
MDREMRLRTRHLVLAAVAAVALDAAAVAGVYVTDASRFGPLRRFYGPWGLPCWSEARCPAPCADTAEPPRLPRNKKRTSLPARAFGSAKGLRPTEGQRPDGPQARELAMPATR